jgi:hypothetical protein
MRAQCIEGSFTDDGGQGRKKVPFVGVIADVR